MNKILIVDDNKKNIQLLANVLTQEGYKIEFSLNGFDAIEWIKEQQFDLVLLDVMMPEMDGFETCIKIKQIPDASEIPIIFITARTDAESISKGFNSGGVDYISKPFNNDELIARVKTHIELRNKSLALIDINKNLENIIDERTNRLKEYAFITSHNLRKPLANIIGFIAIIESAIKNNHNVEEIIKHLKNSSDELDKLIKETANILNLK